MTVPLWIIAGCTVWRTMIESRAAKNRGILRVPKVLRRNKGKKRVPKVTEVV